MRTRARKFLLQCRYAADLSGSGVSACMEDLGFPALFDPDTRTLIRSVAEVCERNRGDIARLIGGALSNWSLDRLSAVTRLLLEQSVAEARFLGTPAPVVIREAVRIAEEFDQPGSGAFVNGVLHRILVEEGGDGPADSAAE
jgi:transcription antitermination factor NusB